MWRNCASCILCQFCCNILAAHSEPLCHCFCSLLQIYWHHPGHLCCHHSWLLRCLLLQFFPVPVILIHHLPVYFHLGYCGHPTLCFYLLNFPHIWRCPYQHYSVSCLCHYLLWYCQTSNQISFCYPLLAGIHTRKYPPLWLLFNQWLKVLYIGIIVVILLCFMTRTSPPPF